VIVASSFCLLTLGAKIIASPTAAFCISVSRFISGYSVLFFRNLRLNIRVCLCVCVCNTAVEGSVKGNSVGKDTVKSAEARKGD
jgi:hypothetical protein